MEIFNKTFFIGLLLLFYSFSSSGNFLDSDNNKELVANAFSQWQQGNGSFFDLLHVHVEWTVAGSGRFSGTYKGKQQFIDKAVIPINEQLATDIKQELISLTAEGNIVWLHWRGNATTTTGATYQNEYVWKLEFSNSKIVKAIAFLDSQALDNLFVNQRKIMKPTIEETKEYIGMWVTKDGYVRHELLPDNRYDEARGKRTSAYQGSYEVSGNHISYQDDTGFTADGEFKDGILYHAGMILYKVKNNVD